MVWKNGQRARSFVRSLRQCNRAATVVGVTLPQQRRQQLQHSTQSILTHNSTLTLLSTAPPPRHQKETLRLLGARQIRRSPPLRALGPRRPLLGQRHDLGLRLGLPRQVL